MSPKGLPKWSGKVGAALAAVLFIAVVAAVVVSIRQQYTSTGLYRMDYEGRIVDKSKTVTESQTGSGVKQILRVRAKDGEEFQVHVNGNLYEQAKVGMWVKSRGGSAELTPDEPR
jgi:hypothetical protein